MNWKDRLTKGVQQAAGVASAAWEGTAEARSVVAAQAGQLAGRAGELIKRDDIDTDGVNRMVLLLLQAGILVESDSGEVVPIDVREAAELAAELAGAYKGIVTEENVA